MDKHGIPVFRAWISYHPSEDEWSSTMHIGTEAKIQHESDPSFTKITNWVATQIKGYSPPLTGKHG
jgi:hypothetical protein